MLKVNHLERDRKGFFRFRLHTSRKAYKMNNCINVELNYGTLRSLNLFKFSINWFDIGNLGLLYNKSGSHGDSEDPNS